MDTPKLYDVYILEVVGSKSPFKAEVTEITDKTIILFNIDANQSMTRMYLDSFKRIYKIIEKYPDRLR